MRPNLAHSDSKLCVSSLVHASQTLAIEFLTLSGSKAPDPLKTLKTLKTLPQAVLASRTLEKQ